MGFFKNFSIGDYPPEFNPKVHGPYDPAIYYGKPDTPFGQLKLSEIGSWLSRRNKRPVAVMNAVSRAYWRWQHKYVHVKYWNGVPFCHYFAVIMTIYYVATFHKTYSERTNNKYHW